MSFWLVIILRGKWLPGKVLGLILGSRKRAKRCTRIRHRGQAMPVVDPSLIPRRNSSGVIRVMRRNMVMKAEALA